MQNQLLKGKIVVVTGGTRGAGRGIAQVMGEAGATVYVTGRSSRDGQKANDQPEATVERAAEEVTALGGVGIPAVVDHTSESDVAAFFERVKQEQGKLDILVNNVWGGYEGIMDFDFSAPFWEQPVWRWDKMFNAGVRAHYLASKFGTPLMLPQKQGLIVNTTVLDKDEWLANICYDLAKTSINKMAYRMARELREHNIAAVALALGWIRTEHIKDAFKVDDINYKDNPETIGTESVQYGGRAILALATATDLMERSGKTWTTAQLAKDYGFKDLDGTQPDFYKV